MSVRGEAELQAHALAECGVPAGRAGTSAGTTELSRECGRLSVRTCVCRCETRHPEGTHQASSFGGGGLSSLIRACEATALGPGSATLGWPLLIAARLLTSPVSSPNIQPDEVA
jgi:hypothetical protein